MKKTISIILILLLHCISPTTIGNAASYSEYGELNLPSDFVYNLPFEVYRDKYGQVQHTFDFGKLHYPDKIYVDSHNGVNTNSGLTKATPVKHLDVALAKAEALTSANVEIVFLEKWVLSNLTSQTLTDQMFSVRKNITLTSDHSEGSFITSGNVASVYSWINESGAYKANRSKVQYVSDYNHKDILGLPVLYQKTNTLAECQAMPGTWYTDSVYVWVNCLDSKIPDDNIGLVFSQNIDFKFTLYGYKFAVDNVHFWMTHTTNIDDALNVGGVSSSSFYAKNSSFRFASKNGLAFSTVNKCYTFDCYSDLNGYDGFNYHGQGDESIFEYRDYAKNNGFGTGGNGNATTAHDGMSILRVGSIGHDSNGPVLADVNGCYSVNFDCIMYNSLRDPGNTKAAFYFDEVSATKEGKAYLVNCQGGGVNTYAMNADGLVEITIKNFIGNNIPDLFYYINID